MLTSAAVAVQGAVMFGFDAAAVCRSALDCAPSHTLALSLAPAELAASRAAARFDPSSGASYTKAASGELRPRADNPAPPPPAEGEEPAPVPPVAEGGDASAKNAFTAYNLVLGKANGVEGDGFVPISAAFLDGATQLTLNCYHSGGSADPWAKDDWYGAERNVDAWLGAVSERLREQRMG